MVFFKVFKKYFKNCKASNNSFCVNPVSSLLSLGQVSLVQPFEAVLKATLKALLPLKLISAVGVLTTDF